MSRPAALPESWRNQRAARGERLGHHRMFLRRDGHWYEQGAMCRWFRYCTRRNFDGIPDHWLDRRSWAVVGSMAIAREPARIIAGELGISAGRANQIFNRAVETLWRCRFWDVEQPRRLNAVPPAIHWPESLPRSTAPTPAGFYDLRMEILAAQPAPGERKDFLDTLMLIIADAIYENAEGDLERALEGLKALVRKGQSRFLTMHIEAMTAPTMPPEPSQPSHSPVHNPATK